MHQINIVGSEAEIFRDDQAHDIWRFGLLRRQVISGRGIYIRMPL